VIESPPLWARVVGFAGAMVVVAGMFVVMIHDHFARKRRKPPNTLGKRKSPTASER